MYLIYLITSIILILIIRRQGRNSFNPIIIYISIWLFVVSLYNLKLIPYNDTNLLTWLVIIFTPIAIWLGYFSFHLISPNISVSKNFNPNKISYCKFFIFLFGSLLFIRVISVWFGIYLRFGSFSAAFTSGDMMYEMSRTGEWAPGIGFYIPVDYISMFFLGIYHNKIKKINLLIIIVFLSNIFLHLGLQNRFSLLLSLCMYVGAYIASNGAKFTIKPSSLIKYISALIALLFVISLSRNLSESNKVAGEFGEYGLTVLPSLYYYLTNGIAGLNEYIIMGIDENNYLYTFNPLLYYLSFIDSSISVSIYETVTYYTPLPTIIATWIRFLVDDFGFIGMFIFLYLTGMILRYVEFVLKKNLSIFWASIYTHILVMFIYSFFGYTFFIASFWYSLIISSLIGLIIDSNIAKILFGSFIKKRRQ